MPSSVCAESRCASAPQWAARPAPAPVRPPTTTPAALPPPPPQIFFFQQGMLPAMTEQGRVIVEAPGRLAMAPDGNGGVYVALKRAGVLADMAAHGVEAVDCYCVDNALVGPLGMEGRRPEYVVCLGCRRWILEGEGAHMLAQWSSQYKPSPRACAYRPCCPQARPPPPSRPPPPGTPGRPCVCRVLRGTRRAVRRARGGQGLPRGEGTAGCRGGARGGRRARASTVTSGGDWRTTRQPGPPPLRLNPPTLPPPPGGRVCAAQRQAGGCGVLW